MSDEAPRDRPWTVYLLRCGDGSLYCGCTTDLERRLRQHNGEIPGGARYTASRRPVRPAAARIVRGRAAAQRLEARVKRLSAADKVAFLLSTDAP